MPRKNILLAMFDIRPAKKAAVLPVATTAAAVVEQAPVSIKEKKVKTKLLLPRLPNLKISNPESRAERLDEPPPNLPIASIDQAMAANRKRLKQAVAAMTLENKEQIIGEIERAIAESSDVVIELASMGIKPYSIGAVPRSRARYYDEPVPRLAAVEEPTLAQSAESFNKLQEFWSQSDDYPQAVAMAGTANLQASEPEPVLAKSEIAHSRRPYELFSPASREMEIWLENLKNNRQSWLAPQAQARVTRPWLRAKPKWQSWFRFNRKATIWLLIIAAGGFGAFGLVQKSTIGVKNNVTQNGSNAVANLESAKEKLQDLNFSEAADGFALAYDDFNRASGKLNQLGASFISVFGSLPGLGKVKAANNLIEAGQNISKAGENLSLAFATIYKTNLFSFIKPGATADAGSLAKIIKEFKDVLVFADNNIKRADRLLADIDPALIPPDKSELFSKFKERVPEFQQYIGEAINYSDFLYDFVGGAGKRTYLLLLQNNSELRPTGGFPGSYALINFEGGNLKKIYVDDVYQLDAGFNGNIVPPVQMQHITPNWGLRDANWWADFPTSARKIEEFYGLDTGGGQVDGVLTMTPDVIGKILDVIGAIDMPEYGLKLDSRNFLDQIQDEVEYKADRAKPKKILSDLQPKFFAKLAQQDKNHWLEIFKILLGAAKEKHILTYFNNSNLESIAVKNGFAGEMKQSEQDYLQVVYVNVKGSKTDFVTDSHVSLKVAPADSGLEHQLTISRVHNGGDSQYGFYNRDNSAYIKVFAPAGAVLTGVQGQSITNYKPLIQYGDFGFKKDPDLERLEAGVAHPYAGVDVFQESGKTVFGFWLVVKPHDKKTVSLSYTVPAGSAADGYHLYWQKQSGTDHDQISFSFKLPDDKQALSRSEGLQLVGNTLTLDSDLLLDREVDIKFR